jgi:parvulin-like peptidyl-prolyl isomerase
MNLISLKIKAFIYIIVITLISCTSEDEVKKDVVAQVNLSQVTDSELEAVIPPTTPTEVKVALKRNLMEKWIEEEIFYQTALRDGITLSADEQAMVDKYKKNLVIKKFLEKKLNVNYRVLDQEIEDYYDRYKKEFIWDDTYVHIIHLVMDHDDQAIRDEIRKSKSLMEVIQKNFFEQQSSEQRPIGDLGYVKLNELPDRLVKQINLMKTGTISRPVKTEYGYHYVQLLDIQKADAIKDLEIVKDEIILRLKIEKRNAEIERLKQQLRADFAIQTDLSKLSQPLTN